MNQTRNQNLPDFGDRYSANRTKDRLRREQQNKGHLPDGQKSENPRDRNPGGPRGGPGGSMNNQGPSRSDRPWNTDSDNRQNNLRGSDRGGDPRNFSNNSNSDRPGSDNSAPNNLPPR